MPAAYARLLRMLWLRHTHALPTEGSAMPAAYASPPRYGWRHTRVKKKACRREAGSTK